MAELSKVYDLFFPSPSTLKILASMEIAMILWRKEIQQNITEEGKLRERQKKTSLECLMTELKLPQTTQPLIELFVIELGENIPDWVSYHTQLGILKLDVLKHFLDFAYDFDGDIHYGRTAKRFVICEGISNDVKFRMACFYCLEDDIFRIWPEVSSHMTTNEIEFRSDPKLYYWVCRLRKQMHEIQAMLPNNTSYIEEFILEQAIEEFNEGDWPSQEYFINLLPFNARVKYMTLIANLVGAANNYEYHNLEYVFFRHFLAKLNETELAKFIHEKGDGFISLSCPSQVIHVWAYIKNKMTSNVFCRLVVHILKKQTGNSSMKDDTFYLRELWISAPNHLKQAAIRRVLLIADHSYFNRDNSSNNSVGARRSVSFLLAMLLDTQIEDRRKFWNEHWQTLFIEIRPDDLLMLVNVCFDKDIDRISQFTEEAVSENNQKIYGQLKKFLREGLFYELEEFLMFWYPNEQTTREVCLMLLHDDFTISIGLIGKASSLNKLIDYAYEDKKLATEFKNKLLLVPDLKAIENIKTYIARGSDFLNIRNFVETFAPSDKIVAQIKNRDIKPALGSFNADYFDEFVNFLNWLFESVVEISRFKLSWEVDSLIGETVRDKIELVNRRKLADGSVDCDWFSNCFRTRGTPDSFMRKFLDWFFETPEDIETFINANYPQDHIAYAMLNRLLL